MIRKAIHDHMILNDLSAQDVADRCGISVNTVHNIVSGKTQNPNIDTCAMIARGLGISLDFIAGLEFAQKIVDDPAPTEEMPPLLPQPPVSLVPPEVSVNNDLIEMYKQSLKDRNRLICMLSVVVLLLSAALVSLVVFELLHGGIANLPT